MFQYVMFQYSSKSNMPKYSPKLEDVFDTESQTSFEETSSIATELQSSPSFLYLESGQSSTQSFATSLVSLENISDFKPTYNQ